MPATRLLLVDDSAEVAFIVRHLGRRSGLEVTPLADAELAWNALQRQPFEVVLVDVNLPGASGLDFCRWVRAAPDHQQLPLVLFSHWQLPQDIAAGLEAGADFVLSKDLLCLPQDWRTRWAEIVTWLDSRQAPSFVPWQVDSLPPAGQLAVRFNHMLRLVALARLGEEVLRVLLRRAWLDQAPGGQPCPWLTADGCALALHRVEGQVPAETVARFAAVFAEQLWRLVGTAACVPFGQALAGDPETVGESSGPR